MAVALRAEITPEEYVRVRLLAMTAGVSAQEFVGSILRAALGVETGLASEVPPAPGSASTPESSAPAEVAASSTVVGRSAPTARVSGAEKCGFDTPRGVKCKSCGKEH